MVFTGLAKFDGSRQRILKAREFHQIAGRAGRAGFDVRLRGGAGARARDREARAAAKAGDDPKKRRKLQRSKPADGVVGWTEETYERLRGATPEALVSRMRVNHSMILNVINQPADPVATLRTLMEDNHEDERGRARLTEQARSLSEELRLGRPGGAGRAGRARPHAPARARAAGRLRAQPAAGLLRAGRVRPARPRGGDLRARRALRRGVDPRRPGRRC